MRRGGLRRRDGEQRRIRTLWRTGTRVMIIIIVVTTCREKNAKGVGVEGNYGYRSITSEKNQTL